MRYAAQSQERVSEKMNGGKTAARSATRFPLLCIFPENDRLFAARVGAVANSCPAVLTKRLGGGYNADNPIRNKPLTKSSTLKNRLPESRGRWDRGRHDFRRMDF